MCPVLLYGAEARTLLRSAEAILGIFRRVCVGDDFRIRTKKMVYDLLKDMVVVQRIYIQRLRGLGHVVRMEEYVSVRRTFGAGISGSSISVFLFFN